MKTTKCRTSSDFLALTEDIRIILKLTVGRKLLDFLYDPGSQFTMIPKHIYDRLAQEPALSPINKLRVGSSATKFFPGRGSLHEHCNGISKGQEFSINYEPILVSGDVKSCIFGTNSENKLEEVKCSNNNSTILFKRNSGKLFMLKCIIRKNLVVCVFVKVVRTRT